MSQSANFQNSNANDDDGNTELHQAVIQGNLVKNKKYEKDDFIKQNNSGWTPLHLACYNKDVPVEVVRKLVKKNKTAINISDYIQNNTPLHIACTSKNVEKVKVLCDNGANLEAKNKDGDTPLLVACREDDCQIVTYLLQQGANYNVENKKKESILIIVRNSEHNTRNMMEAIQTKEDTIINKIRNLINQDDKEMKNRFINQELLIKELDKKIKFCISDIKGLQNEKNSHVSQIASLREQLNDKTSKVTEYKDKMSIISNAFNKLSCEIQRLTVERDKEVASLRKQLNEYECRIKEYECRIKELESDVEYLSKQMSAMNEIDKNIKEQLETKDIMISEQAEYLSKQNSEVIGIEQEKIILKEQLNTKDIKISEQKYEIDAHLNEINSLNIENDRLTKENELLKTEKENTLVIAHSFEVSVPSLGIMAVEETNLLLEELNSLFASCRFRVKVNSSEDANCTYYLQATVPTDLIDIVKMKLNNLDIELQIGKSWTRDLTKVSVSESAIISTSQCRKPLLLVLDNGRLTIRMSNVVVLVYQGDIALEDVGALLVSTDKHLKNPIGVAEAVGQKAGPAKIKKLHQSVMRERRNKPLDVGEVIHIDSGHGLKARYIMNTVGPEIDLEANTSDVCEELLRETYVNALRYADQILLVSSVAVPAVSAGDVMFCFFD